MFAKHLFSTFHPGSIRQRIRQITGTTKIIIMLLVVISLVAIPVPASADDPQEWYLTSKQTSLNASDGSTHACNNFMSPTAPGTSCGGILPRVFLGLDATAWWYANKVEKTDIRYDEGPWTFNLWYRNGKGHGCNSKIHAAVYSVRPDGSLDRMLASGSGDIHPTSGVEQIILEITCSDNRETEQTILAGNLLALRLWYDPPPCCSNIFNPRCYCCFDVLSVLFNRTCVPSSLVSPILKAR